MVIFALALMAAPAVAAAGDNAQADSPPAQMQQLLQNCDAHRFETIIDVTVGGVTKHSRVKLCGTEGQSDAGWIQTLKDAVTKTAANDKMPPAVRGEIVSALTDEIARLTSGKPATIPPPRANTKSTALDGISPLPPLPAPKPAETAVPLPAPRMIAPGSRAPEYASLPPLPTTPVVPPRLIGALLPQLPRPKMSLICFTAGDVGEVPCATFARDTLLTVRADEDLPSGTSVRFVLNGERRADVELAQLRKGKTQRFPLPSEVCSHIGGGTLEIRVVRAVPAAGPSGQEVGKDGPYDLRC
jgi:hypothetical protein